MPKFRLIHLSVFFLLLALLSLPLASLVTAQEGAVLAGKTIYFSDQGDTSSHFDRGPFGISRFAGMLQLLGAEVLTLDLRREIPEDADLVVVPGATSDLGAVADARLWHYVEEGGRVLYVLEGVAQNGRAVAVPGQNSGFFALTWADIGLQAQNQVAVIEGPIRTVEYDETDNEGNTTRISFEAAELLLAFWTDEVNPNHPITAALDLGPSGGEGDEDAGVGLANELFFYGARPLQVDPGLQEYIAPLVFVTRQDMYGESAYTDYFRSKGFAEYNIGEDSTRGDLILAAAVEIPTSGSRMVWLSDIDFLTNGYGFSSSPSYSQSYLYPANIDFAMNAVAWLLESDIAVPSYPSPAPTSTATITPSPTPTATATPITATPTEAS